MLRVAGKLTNPQKLRYQAVFTIGAPGSGKSFVVNKRWMKHMPGKGTGDIDTDLKRNLSESERNLSSLDFSQALKSLRSAGFEAELDSNNVRMPLKLYTYDSNGGQKELPPAMWEEHLPPKVYQQVKGLEKVVFGTPKHELASFWRQVNPDLYKEELPGYDEENPSYVHEMSSLMSKAYLEAVLKTGDPVIVDGTGANLNKISEQIKRVKAAGYRVSLVWVWVPLISNHIRNLTRPRIVPPDMVSEMYRDISRNFTKLKPLVDRARVEDNRNDAYDKRAYLQNRDRIEAFIRDRTT
jgi:predicted kinase